MKGVVISIFRNECRAWTEERGMSITKFLFESDSATGVIWYSLGIAKFVKKVTYRKERVSITHSNKLFPNLIQWISWYFDFPKWKKRSSLSRFHCGKKRGSPIPTWYVKSNWLKGEPTSRIRLIMSLRITKKGQLLSTKMGFGTPSAITRKNNNH